jgi:hypothetical protein
VGLALDQLLRNSKASAIRPTLVSNLSSTVMRPFPSSIRSSRSWRSWSCKLRLVLSKAASSLSSMVSGRRFLFFLFVRLSSCLGQPETHKKLHEDTTSAWYGRHSKLSVYKLQVVYHNPRIKKILSFNTKKTLSLKIVS